MKKILTFLVALTISYGSFALDPIAGTLHVCVGYISALSDSAFSGGEWTSSNTSVATAGSLDGYVTGVSAGTSIITYTLGTSYVTAVFTVYPNPAAITGLTSWCVGSSVTLSDATSGGVWSSYSTGVASVGSVTGVVTGTGEGTTDIYYTLPTGCVAAAYADTTFGVRDSVSGATGVCVGSTMSLTSHIFSTAYSISGTWSSSNTSVATVSSSGVVTGVASGTATIMYSVTAVPCGTASASLVVTVGGTTSAGTISGASSVTVTGTTTLSETVTGGTWGSSNTAIATISSAGVVTGVSTGTVTISYTVTGCSGSVTTTYTITVTAFDGISGYVVFTGGSAYTGDVKVWLITFNSSTSDLEARDSTVVVCTGDSVFYQFTGEPTDSYRIKASVNAYDSMRTTGYIPTYHTSSFYWHDATVLYHTSGTADTYQEIDMATGTSTTGTGFVSGDVTTGANRGTSTSVPVVGLLMIAESAGSVVQQTLTNSTGNYTFSDLPLGTYTIHPELINYSSIDYTGITLTTAVPRMSVANFIEHTQSHTITPGTTGIANVNPTVSSVIAFPNPTSGKLNVQWQETTTETGNVTITDITGREVYKTTINMAAGTGVNQLDLSGLTNGLYIISVKSGDINYNNKIQVQH